MLIKPALQKHVDAQQARYYSRTRRAQQAKYVGASEIGLCMRRGWYAKNAMHITIDTKHSDTMNWGATRRGVTFESYFWLPAMRRYYGDNLLYAGNKQITLTYGTLRATPDGLLINQPKPLGPEIVVECKTIDPRIPLQEAKLEHVFQAQVQLGMFHVCTEHKPQYAMISYVNASFYDDIIEFEVERDPDIFDQALKRAERIMRATNAKYMPAEGWISGGKECQWCPFRAPCDAIRLPNEPVNDAAPINPQILSELTATARKERAIAAKVSDLEAEQRNLQELIKSRLRDLGLNRIESDGIKLVWSPVKGRPSYDMPKLREAAAALGLDIQQFETVGQATDRLIITLLPKPV